MIKNWLNFNESVRTVDREIAYIKRAISRSGGKSGLEIDRPENLPKYKAKLAELGDTKANLEKDLKTNLERGCDDKYSKIDMSSEDKLESSVLSAVKCALGDLSNADVDVTVTYLYRGVGNIEVYIKTEQNNIAIILKIDNGFIKTGKHIYDQGGMQINDKRAYFHRPIKVETTGDLSNIIISMNKDILRQENNRQ